MNRSGQQQQQSAVVLPPQNLIICPNQKKFIITTVNSFIKKFNLHLITSQIIMTILH